MRVFVALLTFAALLAASCASAADPRGARAPTSAVTGSGTGTSTAPTPSGPSEAAPAEAPESGSSGSDASSPGGSGRGGDWSSSDGSGTDGSSSGATLPGGGRTVLPDHRLVGFAGGRSPAFGRLSIDDLHGAGNRIDAIAAEYDADGRTMLPVFELIAVIAHGSPAADGLYRTHEPDEVIQRYLDAARAHDALLLLNVQPGRADFLDEVVRLEKWLREPDVGVALDPEWAVGPGQVPGNVYGSTTGAELDSVAAYLSSLVIGHDLPEKVMVFHQVHASVVQDEAALRPHDGVVQIKSVDGIGARASKEKTWRTLMSTKPSHVNPGFKLFFDEDTELGPLMTPAQVLALQPTPDYVLYE